MNFKFLFDYFRKCIKLCNEVSDISNNIRLYTYYDFLKSALLHGCLIRQYRYGGFYKIKGCERRAVITYPRMLKIYKKCNDPGYVHLLENKAEFNKHFASLINRIWIYSRDMSLQDLRDLCKQSSDIIIKPLNGVEGRGVSLMHVADMSDAEINALYTQLAQQDVMVEQKIEQHPAMILGSESVNTIRVHTLLDKNGGVHVFKTVLRAGVGDTVVDNYCAGGCVYEIDSAMGVVVSRSLTKLHIEYLYHPGTDICMLGYRIPNWDCVIQNVQKAARLLPQCRLIGWDIAITNDGTEFIEGNENPDYELLEFFGTGGWFKKLKQYL